MARTVSLAFGVPMPVVNWTQSPGDGVGLVDDYTAGLISPLTWTDTYTDNGNGTWTSAVPTDNGDGTWTA